MICSFRSKYFSMILITTLCLSMGSALSFCSSKKSNSPGSTTGDVAVTGVTLNKTSATIAVGGTEQLTATISPSNATNQTITWEVDNNTVATVNNTGLVTAQAVGSATIIVTTSDGGHSAICSITTTPDPGSTLTIAPTSLTSGTGSGGLLSYYPTTASGKTNGSYYCLQSLTSSTTTPAYIVYSIHATLAGTYNLTFLYSFGGTETNIRDSYIVVNGAKVLVDTDNILEFPYTGISDGKWTTYATTSTVQVPLVAGDNEIRLVSVGIYQDPSYSRTITFARTGSGGTAGTTGTGTVVGLPNIANLTISGKNGLSAGTGSSSFYSLSTSVVDSGTGTVAVSPIQDYYLPGTKVTLTATPATGYKFDCWTGDAPSTANSYIVTMNSNLNLKGRFIPIGATQPTALSGFGAIQDDNATPYTLTGGYGGPTVTVTNLTDLTTYLTSTSPYTVIVSGLIDNSANSSVAIWVPSNKTILGDGTGHLKNIGLRFSGENYIIRNLIISNVTAVALPVSAAHPAGLAKGTAYDDIELNGAKHVWIDHCELYSALIPADIYDLDGNGVIDDNDAKDFSDGLIDTKNGAAFITFSNNYFHDHWKALLCGSSDITENGDSAIRMTIHHNYFKDIMSRIPLFRYGKGHFYNNYVLGTSPATLTYPLGYRTDSVVNARNGSQIKVDGNYIQGTKYTLGWFYAPDYPTGYINHLANFYNDCIYPADTDTVDNHLSVGTYSPPYTYTLDAASNINISVPLNAGVGKITIP